MPPEINTQQLLHSTFELIVEISTVKNVKINKGINIKVNEKRTNYMGVVTYKVSFYGQITNWITKHYVVSKDELYRGIGVVDKIKETAINDNYSIF